MLPTSADRALCVFDIASDAVGTNRGFTLQHLDTVDQWVRAWGTSQEIFCEVADDVVVHDPETTEIQFRQIKSYHSQPLGFGDSALRHTVYLFYRNALKFTDYSCKYVLALDGSIRPGDDFLRSWVDIGVAPSWHQASGLLRGIVAEKLAAIKAARELRNPAPHSLRTLELEYSKELSRLEQFDFEALAKSMRFEVSREPLEDTLARIIGKVTLLGISALPAQLVVARAFQEVSLCSTRAQSHQRILTQDKLRQLVSEDQTAAERHLASHPLGVRLLQEIQACLGGMENSLQEIALATRETHQAIKRFDLLPAFLGADCGISLENIGLTRWNDPNPQPDPGYYQGKKAEWRHILAAQDVPRHEWVSEIFRHLAGPDRNCILCAESGQGKTTLMYRTAYNYRSLFTVLEVPNIDFIPKEKAEVLARSLGDLPGRVLLLIDDVTRRKGWQTFLESALRYRHIHILATSRSDEWDGAGLQGLAGRLHYLRPELSASTAHGIFTNLTGRGLVAKGIEYRDAWMRAQRRLLEFVTIATQGEHLEALLRTQVDNLSQDPQSELLRQALRLIATAHMLGIDLSLDQLQQATCAPEGNLEVAVRSLKGEFIDVDADGRCRGLHELRSQKLSELLHDVMPIRNTLRRIYGALELDARLEFAEAIRKRLPGQFSAIRDLMLSDLGNLSDSLTHRRLACLSESITRSEKIDIVVRLKARMANLKGRKGLLWLLDLAEDVPEIARAALTGEIIDPLLDQLAPPPVHPVVGADLVFLTGTLPHLAAQVASWLRNHLATDEELEQRLSNGVSRQVWEAKTLCAFFLWHHFGSPDWFEAYVLYDAKSGYYESTIQPLLSLEVWEERGIVPPSVCHHFREKISEYILANFGEWFTSVDSRMHHYEFTDQYLSWLADKLDSKYQIVQAWFDMRAEEFDQRPDYEPEEDVIDATSISKKARENPEEAAEELLDLLGHEEAPERTVECLTDDTLAVLTGPTIPAALASSLLVALYRTVPQRCNLVAHRQGIDFALLLEKFHTDTSGDQ